MAKITIPYNFEAREYQKPLYNCLEHCNRGVAIVHRRGGKDKTFMNILAKQMFKRKGTYFYILPYYKQARAIIWEGMDQNGFKMIDHIPPPLRERVNNQDMIIETKNGSVVRFLGSENIDSIVGTNPLGVLFSEYSLHKENAWNYLRPILIENNGFALFNGTPRGRNHLYKMYKDAQTNPNWFHQLLTIEDTGVMTKEQVEQEIANGMPRALAMQEFYCSFDAALVGAYYDQEMQAMEMDKRITNVPWEPSLPVWTFWDLGIDDMTCIGFMQMAGKEVRIIDFWHDNGKGLDHYVRELRRARYDYAGHIFPHDIRVRELGSGKSRLQTLKELELPGQIRISRKVGIEDGINMTRQLLSRTWIDKTKCDFLIEALKTYRAAYNDVTQMYAKPVHDWASNPADAFRMLAQGFPKSIRTDLPDFAKGVNYNPLYKVSKDRSDYAQGTIRSRFGIYQ